MTMPAPAEVELVDVTKRFGSVVAVDCLNLTIPAGTYTCLCCGPHRCSHLGYWGCTSSAWPVMSLTVWPHTRHRVEGDTTGWLDRSDPCLQALHTTSCTPGHRSPDGLAATGYGLSDCARRRAQSGGWGVPHGHDWLSARSGV